MDYGCIGEKLTHSFSKEIHNKLFSYEYNLLEIPRDKVSEFLKKRDFRAINVTIPYKETVIPYLDFVSDTAKRIGAVNTIINKNGKLYGYNTDYLGMKALMDYEGIHLRGKKVLILGSGGTGKTAYTLATDCGAKEVLRVSRTEKGDLISYETALKDHTDAQIIINTTPCGMYPNIDTAAISLNLFSALCGVVDAVYNPLRSRLVLDAHSRGIKATGGLYMLVAQAAFAAEKFVGESVAPEKIESIYKEILFSKENIVLTGMPSCGKSTLGKMVAEMLSMDFVDTDTLIEQKAGKPIPQIFENEGEKAFRDLESAVIKEVASLQHTVIATGGGVVLRKENVEYLRQNGKIIFIDRPLKYLITTDDRPLSNNADALKKRFIERYDIYKETADIHFVPIKDKECNARKIVKELENENFGNQRA